MSEFLRATIKAAQEIIPILTTRKADLLQAHTQGVGGDISIGADLLCEAIFVKHLSHIAHIDSEEKGLILATQNPRSTPIDSTIVLDPLDGSDNYASGIPYFGASLALCDKNGAVVEAIVINYCTGELLYDNEDQGSAIRLHISTQDQTSLAPTCMKCGIFEKAYNHPDIATNLYAHKLKFRSLGASALSLAYALEHNFFLFCGAIRKYDALAGLFLCRRLDIKQDTQYLLVSQNKQVFGMIESILCNTTI